jgi:hypothetical protein
MYIYKIVTLNWGFTYKMNLGIFAPNSQNLNKLKDMPLMNESVVIIFTMLLCTYVLLRDKIKSSMSDKKLNSHSFHFDPPPSPQN